MGDSTDQVQEVLSALEKRPRLLFDVLRKGYKISIAGPWVGPISSTRRGQPFRGKTPEIQMEEYRRESPDGRTVALVMRDVPLPEDRGDAFLGTGHPPPKPDWYACPREVDAFNERDRRKGSFEYKGQEESMDLAKGAADLALIKTGFYLVSGPALECSLWLEKANHLCRDILVGSKRPEGANQKIAVVRQKEIDGVMMWAWVVMDIVDPDKALVWGTEKSSLRAKMKADDELRKRGWTWGTRE